MKAELLKANQAKLKTQYSDNPQSAIQDLKASGEVDFANLACNITRPTALNPAGLHLSSGGDGTFECAVEIMLAGWVACAGTTFAAVAYSMKLEIESCEIRAIGTMDFKGTLAVDRESPVGLTGLKMVYSIQSQEADEKLQKLVQLTERYCVVHQTLENPPTISVEIQTGS